MRERGERGRGKGREGGGGGKIHMDKHSQTSTHRLTSTWYGIDSKKMEEAETFFVKVMNP